MYSFEKGNLEFNGKKKEQIGLDWIGSDLHLDNTNLIIDKPKFGSGNTSFFNFAY